MAISPSLPMFLSLLMTTPNGPRNYQATPSRRFYPGMLAGLPTITTATGSGLAAVRIDDGQQLKKGVPLDPDVLGLFVVPVLSGAPDVVGGNHHHVGDYHAQALYGHALRMARARSGALLADRLFYASPGIGRDRDISRPRILNPSASGRRVDTGDGGYIMGF